MDPTSLPTDNLYKFMALAGLGIVGFSVWFWWTRRAAVWAVIGAIERDQAVAAVKQEFIAQRSELLKQQAESTQAQRKDLFSLRKLVLENPIDDPKSAYIRTRVDSEYERLSAESARLGEAMMAEHGRSAAIMEELQTLVARGKETGRALRDLRVLSWGAVGAVVLGLVLSTYGFVRWYQTSQRYTDEQTKADYEDHMAELAEKRAARLKGHKP